MRLFHALPREERAYSIILLLTILLLLLLIIIIDSSGVCLFLFWVD